MKTKQTGIKIFILILIFLYLTKLKANRTCSPRKPIATANFMSSSTISASTKDES